MHADLEEPVAVHPYSLRRRNPHAPAAAGRARRFGLLLAVLGSIALMAGEAALGCLLLGVGVGLVLGIRASERPRSPRGHASVRFLDDDAMLEFEAEMARARRHGHDVSMVAIAASSAVTIAADDSTFADLRRFDRLVLDPQTGSLLILLPETDSAGAALVRDRLALRLPPGAGTACASATFPEDVATLRQLIDHVQRGLRGVAEVEA